MSWMQQLYQTYQNHISKIGTVEESGAMLWPIAHTTAVAHVQIHLDQKGIFLDAKPVPGNGSTLIPCTESSASRSGTKPTAHPLSDKLQYLAGDFLQYGGEVTSGFREKPEEPREKLLDWLRRWNSFSPNEKLKAVIFYLKKNCLIHDLVRKKILPIDDATDTPKLLTKVTRKIKDRFPACKRLGQGQTPKDVMVIWVVEVPGEVNETPNLWENEALWDSWIQFYQSTLEEESWCAVTGRYEKIASLHSKKIRNGGDGTKIISSNDHHGFTFRGRFMDKIITDENRKHKTIGDGDQAVVTSFVASQKAHNALRWLIARQGFKNDDQVIVSWAVSGKDTPKLTDNSFDFLEDSGDVEVENADVVSGDAGQRFALRLNKKISGYQQNLGVTDQIVTMGLDSATLGRLSIVFYRELSGSEFLERLEKWHLDFAWTLNIVIKKENSNKSVSIWRICAPAPKDIALAAYGKRVDGKLEKATIERLLPCIVDGNPLPRDLLESTIRRVSNRESMEHLKWQQSLGIACALFKGYYARHPDSNQRRSYQMTLEREHKSRDYLYGRLLAVAEQVESCALGMANEKRITNAERLMLRFSSHPCSTWKTIEESLRPYKDRLRVSDKAGLLHYWEQETEQACSLFSLDEFTEDKPLSGEYLLGYHHQKHYRKPKNDDSTEQPEKPGE